MPEVTVIIVLAVFLALAFDYINGFHDTANAIATVVSTRVLSPAAAVIMAGILNFAGAMLFEGVAKTVSKGIVNPAGATEVVVLGALVGAIAWNIITWVYGIPSSSSHALIGGLIGAGMAKAGPAIVEWHNLLDKVVIPLIGSPLAGFIVGFLLMRLIAMWFAHSKPVVMSNAFRRLQLVSSALMAFTHGQNDAQKSMGIITLALLSGGYITGDHIPTWVKLSCAIAMGLGTAAGGWRIIHTVGQKISRLEPVHGFAAETTGAAVLFTTAHFGMPVSTTHTITASIFGVASSKRRSAVRWGVARNVVMAWVITFPASAAGGAISYWILSRFLGA